MFPTARRSRSICVSVHQMSGQLFVPNFHTEELAQFLWPGGEFTFHVTVHSENGGTDQIKVRVMTGDDWRKTQRSWSNRLGRPPRGRRP